MHLNSYNIGKGTFHLWFDVVKYEDKTYWTYDPFMILHLEQSNIDDVLDVDLRVSMGIFDILAV